MIAVLLFVDFKVKCKCFSSKRDESVDEDVTQDEDEGAVSGYVDIAFCYGDDGRKKVRKSRLRAGNAGCRNDVSHAHRPAPPNANLSRPHVASATPLSKIWITLFATPRTRTFVGNEQAHPKQPESLEDTKIGL